MPVTRPNLGLCNTCRDRVPAEFLIRDNQVWIRKDCPRCGPNEALVSSDAAAWQAKRRRWNYVPLEPVGCTLNCDRCGVDHRPNMVFLDVTNRCNMNCPICIATIRGMGFDFNPPMEYFEKIFAHIARMDPQPVVMLFGGEPTVRDDLLDIIALARRHGLKAHVTTNGVRLADEEYCRRLCQARVPMRFAFDGRPLEIYEKLRRNRAAGEKKLQGLENLRKYSRRKHSIIACAAWGVNDQHLPDMLQYIHDNRDLISDLGIIPLTENWEKGEFNVAAHTTLEDVEKMVTQAVGGGEVEFIPAGLSYAARKLRPFFRRNPRSELLLLAGVHPNCESLTLLVSDGRRYRGLNHYLRRPFGDVASELVEWVNRLEPRLARLDPERFWQRLRGKLICVRAMGPWILGAIHWRRLVDGNPVLGILKLGLTELGRRIVRPWRKTRRPRRILRVAVLPFEEQHSVDAARMESCKAVFAYEDADDGQVKTIPACLWYPYRNALLEKLSGKYGVVGKAVSV